MEFGTCCHWVLEQAYGTEMGFVAREEVPDPEWVFSAIQSYAVKWANENAQVSGKMYQQQEQVYGLAEAVMPAYFKRWDGDFIGNYTYGNNTSRPAVWLSLEEVFDIPFKFDDRSQTRVRGKRDGVFHEPNCPERRWVLDTKCLSVIKPDEILDTMDWDVQQMLYMWSYWRETRQYPTGNIKNVIRRPGHRQGASESKDAFYARVANELWNPAKFDHNFARYQMQIVPAELRHWEEIFLRPLMIDIRGWWDGSHPHYINPNSLISKYGRSSLFGPVAKNDYSGVVQREHVYPELEV